MTFRRCCFTALIVLVLVITIFYGCSKKEDEKELSKGASDLVYLENGLSKDEKVELNLLMPSQGMGKDYFQYAVDTFEERFPNVKVKVRWVEGRPAYRNLIQSLLQSGNDEDMYDYFYGFEGWTEQLIEQGKIEPQDDLWQRTLYDNPKVKVKDGILADERLIFKDGHVFSLPEGLSVLGLFYNKKMFKKNGWTEEPKDWEQFLSLCAEIKKSGINPMVIAGQVPGYLTFTWGAIPFEVGGQEYADNLYNWKPNIYLDPAYITMLERLETFVKKGYFHPGTISFDHTQAQMEFLQEEAAMVSSGCWIEKEMESVMPTGFEWGFMPFPGNNKGQKKVVLTSESQPGYIWKNRPTLNKQWAKEFKLWCLNLKVQKEFMATGLISVRKDFKSDSLKGETASAVSVVQKAIQSNELIVQTNRQDFRIKPITNVEMAKMNKTIDDGYVKIITKKANAKQVAEDTNRQYMKALAAAK